MKMFTAAAVTTSAITLAAMVGIGVQGIAEMEDDMITKQAEKIASEIFDNNQVRCLALNVYHEARGEPLAGQQAVADVTMNRVKHDWFPNTVCEVVWQKKQFSWTHDNISDEPKDVELFNEIFQVAYDTYHAVSDDITAGALFYHADRVNPHWADDVEYYASIGQHKFYHWDGVWK